MKIKITLGAFALGSLLVFSAGCKKDSGNTETNQLCDGTSSTEALPLTDQNHWEWKQDGSGSIKHQWDIGGTATYLGKTYVKVTAVYDN